MRVQIVTPDNAYFDGEATRVVVPAWDGELGVLPGHAPLIARLGHGVARVDAAGGQGKVLVAIYGGFLKVQDDVVTVLAGGAAKKPDNAKVDDAAKAVEKAQARLDEVRQKGKTGLAQLPDAEEQVRRARAFAQLVAS